MANSAFANTDGLGRASALKAYYARYLQTVRGLRASSVRHYLDALNNISRRLVSKELVHTDIYEITDLDYLESVRNILLADPEFIELNERGNQMYSAGLNNYYRFASGEDYAAMFGKMETMDIPLAPDAPVTVEQTYGNGLIFLGFRRLSVLISNVKLTVATRRSSQKRPENRIWRAIMRSRCGSSHISITAWMYMLISFACVRYATGGFITE